MCRPKTSATLAAILAAWCGVSRADDDAEVRALIQRVRESVPRAAFMAKATLSSSGGWVRQFEMRHKPMGEERATLINVTSPNDVAGTRFLFLERTRGSDRQFVFMPKLSARAVEVMAAARQQPFLGSDFYVSDLVAPDVDAFTYRFVGEETIDGHVTRLIEAIPKDPAGHPYARTVLAVEPKEVRLFRVQSYDPRGQLLKVWSLAKDEKIDGIWTPRMQKMVNVQRKTESVLELSEVQYNADLRDELFSREAFTR